MEKIGLRRILVSDGPSGVRGETWDERDPSLNLPSATALASAWDPDIARRYGAAAAVEARRKGVDVVLGPTINLHRSPLNGRHFECFSEDPVLTADLAAAYVRGVQDNGVGATPKHYIANDSETDRFTVDVQVDERPLRELYLLAFEKAITEAHAWLVMSSYNSVNGATVTENDLLETPLNSEWGFDGVVISDWTAVRSLDSARASQDLVMPGPDGPWGAALVKAVEAGDIDESVVDRKVLRILRLAQRVGALEGTSVRARARRGRPRVRPRGGRRGHGPAGEPFRRRRSRPPVGGERVELGRGDRRQRRQRPDAGRRQRHRAPGVHGLAPRGAARRAAGRRGHLLGRRGVADRARRPAARPADQPRHGRARCAGAVRRRVRRGALRRGPAQDRAAGLVRRRRPDQRLGLGRADHALHPADSGTVRIGFAMVGRGRVWVDGELVIDEKLAAVGDDLGAAFLTPPSATTPITLTAGTPVDLRFEIELGAHEDFLAGALSFQFGTEPDAEDHDALIAEAAEAAAKADVALVVVGTNSMVESEGFDRDTLALPGRQDDLVSAVAAANPRTVVLVNAGSPVLMPWRDEVAAVLVGYFGGQEFGDAVADVLLGAVEPGGRLPTTWGATDEDVPVLSTTPVDGALDYTEGIHIGYRAWLKHDAAPAYWFGHGLGYTDIAVTDVSVPGSVAGGEVVTLTVSVENRGEREGKQVVQVYAERAGSAVDRPVRWLVGYAPVRVAAGESTTVGVEVSTRLLAYWADGWTYEPGAYTLRVGTSVVDLPLDATVELTVMSARPNPLVPGFNPDPSVVLVDGTYYLATSTFEYLPGLPIYRSTDLVEWTHIGNVATRPEQVAVEDVPTGGGVWAPTIRHHDGVFYLIVTIAMSARGCVVFTATDPAGPWSDGIDHRRGRRHRPRPRVGRGRQRLRDVLGPGHVRRGPRQAPRHPAGAGRPGGRQGDGGAALAVVRDRTEVPRGAARLPARRALVPDDRRGRHRARPRRQLRPRPVDRGPVREPPGQPAAQRAQHLAADPEHRPRRPRGHPRWRLRADHAGHATARSDPVVLPAGPRDVHHRRGLGRRLAPARAGPAGARGPGSRSRTSTSRTPRRSTTPAGWPSVPCRPRSPP